MTVLVDLLRGVLIFFDSLVYGLASKLYALFMEIASANIFTNETLNAFADRVYALLAIFMLFKLSFSFLTYIINPESVSDKSTGGGKLIVNILITIVLLISVPWLFRQALQIQNDILQDNIIGKIILGTKETDVSTQLTAGDTMAWTTFSAFFYPTEDICPDGIGDTIALNNCIDELEATEIEVANGIMLGTAYKRISDAKSVSGVSQNDLVTLKDENDNYIFEYNGGISLIAGGFIAYTLLLFCIQIAVRTVKLGVLQLVAPIPVISYLDPKQGKDGMFKKWLSLTGKTFADLFIRLAAIYFAVFIVSEIMTTEGALTNSITGVKLGGFAKVLVILGALSFAKELPKFIEEILGIKLDGKFSLNPMKTLSAIPLVGGGLVAGAGLAGAGMLAAGRLGAGVVGSGAKALVHKVSGERFGESFKSGMATAKSKAGMRMQAGMAAASTNWRNFSGDGKYTSSGEKYKSLTEDYSKGKKNFKEIDKNWVTGAKAEEKLKNAGMSFSDLDGFNKNAYERVYSHDEFVKSLMNVDKQDAVNKEYVNALYEAQTMGVTWGGTTINGVSYNSTNLSQLKADAEKAQKSLTGLEKVHDTMRQKYGDDAKVQDGIKAKKYNPDNPTGNNHGYT